MARSGYASRPGRALTALVILLAALFGVVAAGTVWSSAQWSPKLALDLEGGYQIILRPVPQAGGQGDITQAQLAEAVNIIRQRVNGSGVSEAEVTTQGNQNIIVALPGTPDAATRELVKQSAQLSFRAVLVAQDAQPQPTSTATASPSATSSPGASGSATPSASASATASAGATAKPKSTTQPHAASGELTQHAPKAATSPSSTTSPSSGASATPSAGATPTPTPSNGSDLSQITDAISEQFTGTTCTADQMKAFQNAPEDPKKPLVTCSTDGLVKYILGPVEVRGTDVKSATAAIGTNSQGFSTGAWEVDLSFTGEGTKRFATVTTRLAALTGAQNQFAIVLDKLVVSAPATNERIGGGEAQITGNFTQQSATTLANQLKFGALPISFNVQTEQQISALLGAEQLRRGLLAGLIGMVLVVLYSLAQYRVLGSVTILSLAVAAAFTYGFVTLLGWRQGYRLSLPGVAGLIVAIGITADSFIVFFERIRDEVREGRNLQPAVEAAWVRARRTILASDAVSFIAAAVLYVLAVGGVRGFAFTLGLTTLVDILVVFLFTKPTVTLLSRRRFFATGHPLSGFGPEQLGRPTSYAGRGRVRTGGESIAARRAAAARAAEEGPKSAAPSSGTAATPAEEPAGAGRRRTAGSRSGPSRERAPGERESGDELRGSGRRPAGTRRDR